MQQQELEKFKKLLSGVHDFYAKNMSQFSLSVWWEALRQFDYDAISMAMSRHLANPDTGQFMPKPADVMKMLGGTTQDRAQMAWSKVDKALRHLGTYRTVAFDDPLIHRVITDMGGWPMFGQKTENEWPFLAKEFETRYRGFSMRNERPEYPKSLTGLADMGNLRNGFKPADVVLIGDKAAAQKVLAGGTDKPLIGFSAASDAVRLPNMVEVAT